MAGPAQAKLEQRIRQTWLVGVAHGVVAATILLVTGEPVVLMHQSVGVGLVSAAAVVLLAFGVRYHSRLAAFLLFVGVLTPAAIKLLVGTPQIDVPALVLAPIYARGLAAVLRYRRARLAA